MKGLWVVVVGLLGMLDMVGWVGMAWMVWLLLVVFVGRMECGWAVFAFVRCISYFCINCIALGDLVAESQQFVSALSLLRRVQ